jgi:predicted amidohydrolase
MANRAGEEAPLSFLGQSMVIDPMGTVAGSLDAECDKTLTVKLEKATVTQARMMFPFHRDRRPETYTTINNELIWSGEHI